MEQCESIAPNRNTPLFADGDSIDSDEGEESDGQGAEQSSDDDDDNNHPAYQPPQTRKSTRSTS